MNMRGKGLLVPIGMCLCWAMAGCAGVKTSSYSYNDAYKVDQPSRSADCYDAAVLLGKNLSESGQIAKKVLLANDATISEESETQITAQRSRHIGLFVGSGGEDLLITLKGVADGRTFVTAATKTGFVGGAGQKAWSCQIVDQMAALAAK